MRKQLSIILTLAIASVMAYGVIGSGANFSSAIGGTQQINVGSMTLQIRATGAGNTYEVNCPAFDVTTSSGVNECDMITLDFVGGIHPNLITVHVDVSGAAEPAKFALVGHLGAHNYATNLQTVNGTDLLSVAPDLGGMDFNSEYDWTNLSNASMGNVIYVTYTFTAYQN